MPYKYKLTQIKIWPTIIVISESCMSGDLGLPVAYARGGFGGFHCDAIIPVVKLFWCVVLEPMAGSKCKPGPGQWALKQESCCDVIKTLFSTAMAGQDNVSTQKAFLEENGCNACRYSACDVIILSQTEQLA